MDFRTVGLTENEYKTILRELGRTPNETELRLFGVMWSEHCSYKSTRPLLRLFPTEGRAVVQGPGENAGVVDLGEGFGLAFKVESHNHPSAVEPYQGAATGVGGIIRDILAMGARPVASMDGLFFGDPELRKTKALRQGIVAGIGGYGNAVGVPTVGGKTVYDEAYTENPLVNAFCAGVVRLEDMVRSDTAQPGRLVVLLGAKTGRDGIAGAAFASVELAEDTSASRPQVQIGDPFAEKLLIECCLELLEKGLIDSMQDMGAAGIISSSSEIAAKSDVGMVLDLDRVPLREKGMTPWEIALSESQERMLLIVNPDRMEQVLQVAAKWALDCTVFGETTGDGRYVMKAGGAMVVDLPPAFIGGNAPIIHWPSREPRDLEERQRLEVEELSPPKDLGAVLRSLLEDPNLGNKAWISEQYDSMVQTNTVLGPGGPVSVLRVLRGDRSPVFVAFSMEADPWKCRTDPRGGGAETLARSLRSLSVCGADLLGWTNCLNFPSPQDPEVFWEMRECVQGMADAARAFSCPVVSGNVSLYNETPQRKILPTPLVVAAGLLSDLDGFLPWSRWREGDHLFLAGMPSAALGASRYLLRTFGLLRGKTLSFDAGAEQDFAARARRTAKEGAARSARALAGGGLAVALAKEAMESGIGARLDVQIPTRPDVFLFGEGGPRALYAVPSVSLPLFRNIWRGFPLTELGVATGNILDVKRGFSLSLAELRDSWRR